MHWDLQLKKQKQNLMTNKLNSMVSTQTLCSLKTSELISESVPPSLPSRWGRKRIGIFSSGSDKIKWSGPFSFWREDDHGFTF